MGVAIATLLTSLVNFLFVTIYCWKFSPSNLIVRPFYFKLSLLLKKEYVKSYLALAFPSILMVCVQMYAYEILLLMASGISVVCFSSMIISTSYLGLCMLFPQTINVASTSTIGNAIGEQQRKLGQSLFGLSYI